MELFQNSDYLRNEQYRDPSRLQARIDLHREFSTGNEPWFHWVANQLDIPRSAAVLELGCGPGDLWAEPSTPFPEGWMITLTDFSPGMLHAAQNKLGGRSDRFRFAAADAGRIPFPPNTFHCVIANHMLYHVPDLPETLNEIHRVLRPEGRLYAATLGEGHMEDLAALVDRFQSGTVRRFTQAANTFTLENGRSTLEAVFGGVRTLRREDDLVVTRSGPLVNYVLSSFRLNVGEDHRDEFQEFVENELKRQGGSMTIRKATGLLTGVKRERRGDAAR